MDTSGSRPLAGKVVLVAGATRGAGRAFAVERGLHAFELSREYGFTDPDGTQPDAWRYVAEVQRAGKPPDDAPYRRRPAP